MYPRLDGEVCRQTNMSCLWHGQKVHGRSTSVLAPIAQQHFHKTGLLSGHHVLMHSNNVCGCRHRQTGGFTVPYTSFYPIVYKHGVVHTYYLLHFMFLKCWVVTWASCPEGLERKCVLSYVLLTPGWECTARNRFVFKTCGTNTALYILGSWYKATLQEGLHQDRLTITLVATHWPKKLVSG